MYIESCNIKKVISSRELKTETVLLSNKKLFDDKVISA